MSIDINIPGYTLIREIGKGGMATVYLGMQTLLERKVAIKILHQRLSAESDEFDDAPSRSARKVRRPAYSHSQTV